MRQISTLCLDFSDFWWKNIGSSNVYTVPNILLIKEAVAERREQEDDEFLGEIIRSDETAILICATASGTPRVQRNSRKLSPPNCKEYKI